MPYKTIKVNGGYKNKNTTTNKVYSKKAMTKSNVEKQMKILKRFEKKKLNQLIRRNNYCNFSISFFTIVNSYVKSPSALIPLLILLFNKSILF